MKKLKASIIIPMYNAEKNIKELISALSGQTEKSFEVIIVDDGSTDDSAKIISKIRTKFDLKLIKQKNSGPAIARNKGVRRARAEIIIFLDSDCIPKEDFVEKLIEPFKDKEIVGVQGEYETKNKNFLIARYIGYEIYYRHESMKNREIDHIATYGCAYRKKDFGKGFLDFFYMEDIEFSYRLSKKNKRLMFNPEARVEHFHLESFWKFIKQQFFRGYWRVRGHTEHPEKMLKDSYLGYEILVQGGLSLLFIATFIASLISVFISPLFLLIPLSVFILICITNLPFGAYCTFYEPKMLFIAPLIASIRSVSGTLGFLYGIFYFKLIKNM